MPRPVSRNFKIGVPGAVDVTAKLDTPNGLAPSAALLLAHGSNNDLDHSLLAYLAARLAETAGIAVLRFNFAYAERGADSPDSALILEAAFRAAHARLASGFYVAGVPVFVGGKSLGGRVAAEMVSRRSEGDGVNAVGLVELGYPLHAPGRSDRINLKPLRHIDIPSLFCIGSHDPFCDLELLRPALPGLVVPGELYVVEGGDHSLNLPHSLGREPEGAYEDVTRKVAAFVTKEAARWRS
jgi:predicted alpha/beta-hydrolase family hydrolase